MLKAGMAGLCGLSLPRLLEAKEQVQVRGNGSVPQKSVILIWMTGGPSQIDTWDLKPGAIRKRVFDAREAFRRAMIQSGYRE